MIAAFCVLAALLVFAIDLASHRTDATFATTRAGSAAAPLRRAPERQAGASPRAGPAPRQSAPPESFAQDAERLLARADYGDADAASSVFQETSRCAHAASFVRNATVTLRVCGQETRPEFVQRCQRQTDGLRERITRAQAQADACGGTSEPEATRLRYRAAVLAARSGDEGAQACIVQADFDQRFLDLTDADREQYQIAAIAYYNSALERGDWRVLPAMTISRRSLGHVHGLQRLLTDGDEETRYRMTRLLRWGAEGSYAAELDKRLNYFRNSGGPPIDFAAADAWAERQFREHFAQSPRLDQAPAGCGDPL